MTIIKDKIEEKGIKQNWIAEQLEIAPRTLNNWMNYKNLNQVKKFIKLMLMLDVPIIDVLEEIYKNKKE